MNDPVVLVLALLALLFAAGFVVAVLQLGQARARAAAAEARAQMLEDQQARSGDLLRAQAAQSAETVAEKLVARAAESFRSQEQLAQARLESQLKPVAETLAKFEAQVTAMEKARAEDTGGLKQQITELLNASAATQDEARKLSAALRRGAGVQGRWGEHMLRNVLEAAGLQNRFDFTEQVSTDAEEGRRRPDVVVRMPGGGVLVIDAKCSLNAFLEAQEHTDESLREAAYLRHADSVREHVRGLSAKAYWDQFANSPDVVAMFLPGGGYLAAALERRPELLAEAMDKRVVVVTPTTLFALCKAVAYGWRVEDQAKGAAKVAELGRELYKRIAVMGAHAAGVGKALETAVGKYNQFVGSLETQVMSQARRFEELSVDHEGKRIEALQPVETGVRPLAKLGVAEDAAGAPSLTAPVT
jgi:DNA recombination protein RmuC